MKESKGRMIALPIQKRGEMAHLEDTKLAIPGADSVELPKEGICGASAL